MGNIVDKKNGQETRLEKLSGKIPLYVRLGCFVLVIIVYAVLFARMSFIGGPSKTEEEPDEKIFKLVDVQEYVPQEKTIPVQNRKNMKTEQNVSSSEKIIEKDKIEKKDEFSEYVPQNKVSSIPVVPGKRILKRIEYPVEAYKNSIEGVVYLELFIDAKGIIKKIKVLKDPGHGFAEAALKAFDGIVCQPALVNGEAVPVRFRYPVRFSLR